MNSANSKIEKFEVLTYIDARNLVDGFGVEFDRIYLLRQTLISSKVNSVVFMDGKKNVATYRLDEMVLDIYQPARPMPSLIAIMEEI